MNGGGANATLGRSRMRRRSAAAARVANSPLKNVRGLRDGASRLLRPNGISRETVRAEGRRGVSKHVRVFNGLLTRSRCQPGHTLPGKGRSSCA